MSHGIRSTSASTSLNSQRARRNIACASRAVCEMLEQRLVLSADLGANALFTAGVDANWALVAANRDTTQAPHPIVGASVKSAAVKPKAPVISAAAGYGLQGQYFPDSSFTGTPFTRIDSRINFHWNAASPAPGIIPRGAFSVRWTGQLVAPRSGVYKFSTATIGNVRLIINGSTLINNQNAPARKLFNAIGLTTLTAGTSYSIEMDYASPGPRAAATLNWVGPRVGHQPVPFADLHSGFILPSAPADLIVHGVSQSQIDLSWNEVPGAASYLIQRSTNGKPFATISTPPAGVTSFSDINLPSNSSFSYRLIASSIVGNSTPSSTLTISASTLSSLPATLPVLPAAPQGLTAQAMGASEIDLAWQDSANETGFQLQRSPDGLNFATIATLNQGVLAYHDTGLPPTTTYTYRVLATNATGASAPSNTASASTWVGAPTAPASLTATVVSHNQISLSWDDRANDETGFRLDRAVNGGAYATVFTSAPGTKGYVDTSVSEGNNYAYRVYALNSQTPSTSPATASAPIPLAAPTALAATISGGAVHLAWTDTSAASPSYQVQRSTDGGAWATLGTTAANASSFSDSTASTGNTYQYQVLATNANGSSTACDPATAAPAAGVPSTPINLAVTPVSDTEINLTWDRVPTPGFGTGQAGTGETSITIYRSTNGGPYQVISTQPAGSNIWTDTSCYPNTQYTYELTADNANGSSPATAEVSGTTKASAADSSIPAATNLTATAASPFTVNLSWTDSVSAGHNWFIERSSNGISFSIIADLSGTAGTMTYTDSPLVPSTTYSYRMRPVGGSSYGNYCAAVSVTTAARVANTPVEATNLVATVNSGTSVTLTWTDTNSGTASYLIETAAYSWTNTPAWTQVGQTAAGATSYNLTTTPEMFYYVRIRAANSAGDSGYTPQVAVRTASPGTGSPKVYNIGPGQPYTSLGALNWSQLGPGDTVYIYPNRDSSGNIIPYYEKPLISVRGTAAAPINIIGVADPATGQMPIIDGTNAVTNSQWQKSYLPFEDLSVLLVGVRINQTSYGWSPGYLGINSLEVRNGYSGDPGQPANTYTAYDGTIRNYIVGAASIYIEKGDHITIQQCSIHGSNNGIFAAGQNDGRNIQDISIVSNLIYGNGTINNFGTHNTYIEGVNTTYEFNDYGPLRQGATGLGLKDRGAGTVIRYNWLEGGEHIIDLVEAQNYASVTLTLPSYSTTLVYGNVILDTSVSTGGATTPVYYGGDTIPSPYFRKGVLEFYNNTFVETADQSQQYYVQVFDTATPADALDARNNIIFSEPATSRNAPELDLLPSNGTAYFGSNWVSAGWFPSRQGQQAFTGHLAGAGNFIGNNNNDPGFVSASMWNFALTPASQCVDAAAALPSDVPPLQYEYTDQRSPEQRQIEGLRLDLGAYEASA